MVEIADIKNRESLKTWLKDRPHAAAIMIAARSAARVAPMWWAFPPHFDLTPIPFLRSCLISTVAAKMPTDDIKVTRAAPSAASTAARALHSADLVANYTLAASAAAYAAHAAAYPARAAVTALADIDAVVHAVADTAARAATAFDLWPHIRRDLEVLTEYGPHHWPPLWEADFPFAHEWSEVQKTHSGNQWVFWRDWYQRLLDGDPFPEDYLALLHEIATQENEFWEGEEAKVNGRIAERYEKYRLLQEVRELKAALAEIRGLPQAPAPRNHNNPPELIDSSAQLVGSVEIIWPIVEEAEKELEKPDEKPSRIRALGAKLLEGIKKAGLISGKAFLAAVAATAGKVFAEEWVLTGRLLKLAKDLFNFGNGG